MDKRKPSIKTIVLWALLAALIVVIALLAPKTWQDYQTLETERNATPTPTSDVSSAAHGNDRSQQYAHAHRHAA